MTTHVVDNDCDECGFRMRDHELCDRCGSRMHRIEKWCDVDTCDVPLSVCVACAGDSVGIVGAMARRLRAVGLGHLERRLRWMLWGDGLRCGSCGLGDLALLDEECSPECAGDVNHSHGRCGFCGLERSIGLAAADQAN